MTLLAYCLWFRCNVLANSTFLSSVFMSQVSTFHTLLNLIFFVCRNYNNFFACRNYNSQKGVYGFNAPGWNEMKEKLNEGNPFVGDHPG